MDIEAYKVAVKLSLSENITQGLMAISGRFAGVNRDAEVFRSKLETIGKMTLAGGALVGVGYVITKGLDATIKAANDLVKAQNDFKTLNLTAQENASVNSSAQIVSHQVLGTTIAGNIRLIQDLHTALGDLHHSIELAPMFAKYESTIRMALGEHATDGMVNAAARALEHRGGNVVNNPKEFKKELEWMSQVQLASKGRVNPKDFLSASQSGKMAYTLLDPKYLYGGFAGLMSMNGGFQSGTALMTSFSSLIGGHMDKKAKGFLADIGMYDEGVSKARMKLMANAMKGMSPSEKAIYMQSLGGESLLSGGLSAEYVKMFANPDQLAAVMASKIRERFGKNLTDTEVAEIIAKNFNRNTGNFLGQHVLNATKFAKDSAIFRHAQDFNSAYDTYLNSPDGAAAALSASWMNVKAVLGIELIPTLTNVTLGLAHFMDKVSKFAEDNPWATKIAIYSATAVAGLALLSGGILLLGATIMAARLVGSLGVVSSFATLLGGPVVWAIVAATAAGVLLYKNWDQIKPAAKQMGKDFSWIIATIWDRVKEVGVYIKNWSIWDGVQKALDDFSSKVASGFDSLFNKVISLLNKIPGVNIQPGNPDGPKPNNSPIILPPTNTPKTPSEKYAEAMQQQGKSSKPMGMAEGMSGMYRDSNTPKIPSKQNQPIQVNSTINLDGKPIARVVTKHQSQEAARPPTSTSAFDSTRSLVFPGQVSSLSAN
ncbi:hypothetical protein BED35_07630 [Yersinia enterocolitica]|uniref:hypothetical protein n=1 Tax=Yersinia enterocolitica TaxID=630 RepID=UPI0005DDF28D|nr:hypothetical protein [Yersinia enterocolitica]AOF18428.1 hypothetical protein BED34_07180 [Yersinia enterocolitica]AOF22960.1 hypothetical protein BED33_09840 [Yersinia enterocolitica]AOF26670.1 hypothetical protein BED32_07155 [Yersinia enterocolitica]AOF30782.1 hypothetical protein BED35_07630 [Yersinia enterocolitica]AOF34702.1 hypothetical protein BFS78_06700 [Yersinia enterocolitica]